MIGTGGREEKFFFPTIIETGNSYTINCVAVATFVLRNGLNETLVIPVKAKILPDSYRQGGFQYLCF